MSRKKAHKKQNLQADVNAARKAEVLGGDGPVRSMPLAAGVAIAVILLAAAAGMAAWLWPAGSSASAAAGAGEGIIAYEAADFADGKARHYSYKTDDGLTVKYFILKSSDGVIRAAYDACDVCWRSGLGYYQEGDYMVCRNCGRRFASVQVNEVQGGCNPAPLSRRIEDGQVFLKISDILDGRRFFDLSS